MNCYETIDLMDLALEGAITSEVQPEFDAHLEECGPCRTYFEQLGDTVRALRNLSPAPEANPRRAELLERFTRRAEADEPHEPDA